MPTTLDTPPVAPPASAAPKETAPAAGGFSYAALHDTHLTPEHLTKHHLEMKKTPGGLIPQANPKIRYRETIITPPAGKGVDGVFKVHKDGTILHMHGDNVSVLQHGKNAAKIISRTPGAALPPVAAIPAYDVLHHSHLTPEFLTDRHLQMQKGKGVAAPVLKGKIQYREAIITPTAASKMGGVFKVHHDGTILHMHGDNVTMMQEGRKAGKFLRQAEKAIVPQAIERGPSRLSRMGSSLKSSAGRGLKTAKWLGIAALAVPVVAGVASYMRNRNAYDPNHPPVTPDMDAELPPVLDFTPPMAQQETMMGLVPTPGERANAVLRARGIMPQQQPGAMNPEMSAVDPASVQDLGTPPTRA